jgi:hypothetical protein
MSFAQSRSTYLRGLVVACLVGACFVQAAPGEAATRGTVAGTVDATIRNAPPGIGAGYVIGNALTERGSRAGVTFEQLSAKGEFRYGKVYGNVDFCAWISTHVKLAGTAPVRSPSCPGGSAGRALLFKQFSNGLRNCEPGQCKGGSYAKVEPSKCARTYPDGVPAFGNVLPWLPKAKPHDRYARFTKPYEVHWRYVSRDGDWVMVQDKHARTGPARTAVGFDKWASDWYFVPRACVFDKENKLHK